ncbi:monocarboxylate transporter 12-B-like isoform X2 [Anthonomus grandis grandis]|uniref:monocarboxylate transporter 12-B-like isoform X2 n=1 Tax=Anthonomus grandis grandis TaxID=2921223 RepID=UPI0021661141|nr:monocarboxylate transporter 12-B-like isoform X2 [Anthonomus grandis grandis]
MMAPPNLDSVATPDKPYTLLPTTEEKENEDTDKESSLPEERDSNENDTLVDKSNDKSLDDDVCSDDIEVVVPPDGGWGWVIVFASFMCNLIVDGIIFSFATFLRGIADEFGVTKPEVSIVGSLMSGFYLMVGPFASAIANKFGFRLVAIIGTFLAATAFALSYFATSVEYLCISYGLLGGIGFGFIYVPAVITVGFYFERWRALATGIGVCGSGIGTFLFAPLCEILIRKLGWRSALLVQGGIVFSCVIFGSLFRPLKPTKVKDLDESADDKNPEENLSTKLPSKTKLKLEEALKNMEKADHQHSLTRIFGANNNSEYPRISDVYHTIHVPSRTHSSHVPLKSHFREKRLSAPYIFANEKPKQPLGATLSKPTIVPKSPERTKSHTEDMVRPLYRDDIFFQSSLLRLPQYTSQSSVAYNLAVTRMPTKQDILEEKRHACKLCPEAVKRALATMLDFTLLKSPSFIILAIGGFFTMMGFYVPFMFLKDRAEEAGMGNSTAVFLISSIGIANTLGRVFCGILSSFPSINALFVTNVALTIGGIATILSGLSATAAYQFFYTAVFGLAISTFASLRSIIVVDLLGLERLTNAFGLLLLFQGVAAMIGAPLAGAFKNATGGYDASFYLSGSMLLISAIMCYPLNWINRWEIRRNQERAKMEAV